MKKLIKIVRFASWPTVCGILIAIIILQYQQFEKFNIWIQIAAFSNIKSAKILQEKFKEIQNLNVHKVLLKGRTIYRVRVGPFLSIDKADSVYNFLVAKGMQGTKFIVE